MQSVAPAESATSHALSEAALQQAQRDALETIHKIMLHLAKGLTRAQPSEQEEEEDPAQARTTTQRIRLCLQAARDILRFVPNATSADPLRPQSGSKVAEAPRGRMRVPCDSSNSPDNASADPPSPAEREPVRSGAERTNAGSHSAMRSINPPTPVQGRLRVPCDSPNSPTATSTPPPSPAQRETVRSGAERTNAGSPKAMRSINPPPPEQGRLPCDAQRNEAEPEVNHRGLQDRHQRPAPPPNSPDNASADPLRPQSGSPCVREQSARTPEVTQRCAASIHLLQSKAG